MKLKYKKMILMVSVCTMGIGMVTFTVTSHKADKTTKVESSVKIEEESVNTLNAASDDSSIANIAASVVTPEANRSVMSAEAEVSKVVLEKDANKEINKLISKYLKAKLKGKIEGFKSIVNNTDLIDIEDINRKTKYVEKYENLSCYTVKGPEEGTFLVYAYHEVKFKSIDTLAPGMNEFFVKTNDDGSYYIYLGEAENSGKVDKKTEKYLQEVRESEEVMELVSSVNDSLEQKIKKDPALEKFYAKLTESAKNVSSTKK